MEGRAQRIGRIVARVLADAVRVTRSKGIVLPDDGSAEVRMLFDWCQEHVSVEIRTVEPGAVLVPQDGMLGASLANKTGLLLGATFPGEPLVPLGDLYASQVRHLAGDVRLPENVRGLADAAGGIDVLDHALQGRFESWLTAQQAAERLPEAARGPFLEAV